VSVASPPLFDFEDSFARELEGLYVAWRGAEAPDPQLVVLNEPLALELGADPERLRSPEGVALLAGSGATGIAQAYAGHQFGAYSPRLGDGRALLLGEVAGRDLHLKGSGRTPFARGGDGKAAIGPMLREYLISEAMHALGIPTTRSLAVVTTGATVVRESGPLAGAVLARVGASHLRVGTFQYASATGDLGLVRRLADYAIARHHPTAGSYLDFFAAVVEAQASLVAQWMQVGFIHGVMNTDNMTISGETIDYGPCAFLDAFDPATVFSSIDHGGRYAYGNQPQIAQWNLARLGETLLGLIDEDTEQAVAGATEVLNTYPARFSAHFYAGMRAKLGVAEDAEVDAELGRMRDARVDYTSYLRSRDPRHPVYIPRNHLVEEALEAATLGDLEPFQQLLAVLSDPFTQRPGFERYAEPGPDGEPYVTFCGT
jgi:uncharacterized protein YdiU (UPF0061 family)